MKILIIAEYFYPSGEIAAVRPTKLYKFWKRMGHDVHVVTSKRDIFCADNSCVADIDEEDVYRVACNIWLDKHYNKHKQAGIGFINQDTSAKKRKMFFIKEFIKNKIAKYYATKKFNQWEKNSKKLLKGMVLDYDVVFSTFSPIHTLRLGKIVKEQNHAIKWIADFRDVPSRHTSMGMGFFAGSLVRKVCKKADMITCVSHGVLDDLNLPRELSGIARVITNGYDLDMIKDISTGRVDKFVFSYAGTIYVEGKFDYFFKVIAELIKEGEIDKERIVVNYAGSQAQRLLEQAGRFGLESIVFNYGRVSRGQALDIQAAAHVLLLVSWNTQKCKGILTGKFFEEMMFNRPILAFVSGDVGDSELKQILDRAQAGFCYEHAIDNYDDLKTYVADLYNQWTKSGEIRYNRDQDEIDKYNYKNIAANTLIALAEIVNVK